MKNLLLFSALAFTSGAAWCQLTVKPNGSTDSFIYAENENVIYVKGAIDLQRNSPGDTEASIYLRNGAQLIQGDPNALNSGNGQLSVQQTSPVTNAYAYYYWCSPVGSPTNIGSTEVALDPGSTNFGLDAIYMDTNPTTGIGTKATKSVPIGTKEGYNDPLSISKRWMTVMTTPGTEAHGSYTRINGENGAPAGYGFTMKGVTDGNASANPLTTPSHEQTYEFRGRPNNGDFSIPVLGPSSQVRTGTNPGPSEEYAQMTLTGNPYPSALDLNKVFYESGNTRLNAIYFYDEDRTAMSHMYSGKPYGYAVWIPGPKDNTPNGDPFAYPGYTVNAAFFLWNANGGHNGTATGTSGRAPNAQRYAPIGQGFMFVGSGSNTDEAQIKIKNSHRVFKQEGQYSTFFREGAETSDSEEAFGENGNRPNGHTLSSASGAMIDNRTPQLRLLVTFDDKLSRELLLILSPQASDAYDRGFDALSPMGMKSEVYFPIETDGEKYPYVIQGTNFEPTKMIPLTIELFQAGKVEVKAIEEIRKPYQKAYLYDQVEDIYRPLVSNRAAGTGFNLPAGFYENRFFIVFQQEDSPRPNIVQEQMDIEAKMQMDVKMFQNNPSRQLEIMNPEGYSLKAAYVYDMNGKLVITDTNLGDASNYSFYTGNLSDGMYMVKLITKDEITLSYKAMVINK